MTQHHALDSVHLILESRRRVDTWNADMQTQACLVIPHRQGMAEWAWHPEAWLTTVAVFASEREHPVEAAQRLTKYLLTYRETHGRFPSLEAVQKHAADRHLKEPR